MAFVSSVPVARSGARAKRTICAGPTMVVGEQRLGRRAALHLLALGVGLGVARAVRADDDIDREDLKSGLESYEYAEQVTDVGPNPQAENITREKKKEEEPEFKKENAELLAEGDERFQEMVQEEAAELASIKKKFSK